MHMYVHTPMKNKVSIGCHSSDAVHLFWLGLAWFWFNFCFLKQCLSLGLSDPANLTGQFVQLSVSTPGPSALELQANNIIPRFLHG